MKADEKNNDPGPLKAGEKQRKVGYCSPPPGRPFKPGQSGNPGGRPAGTGQMLKGILRKLNEKAKDGDGRELGKWIDVLLEALFVGAAKGNISLIREIIDRESGRVPLPVEIPPEGSQTYSERIAALFERLDREQKEKQAEEERKDGPGQSDAPRPNAGEA